MEQDHSRLPFLSSELMLDLSKHRSPTIRKSIQLVYDSCMLAASIVKEGADSQVALCLFSQGGKLIWRLLLPLQWKNFDLLSDRLVGAINEQEQSILILDLKQQSAQPAIKHQFIRGETENKIVSFCESGFFCLIEQGDKEVQFTYYNQNLEQLRMYYRKDETARIWNVDKLNDHSKVGWTQRG
jgi:hypothetical protein